MNNKFDWFFDLDPFAQSSIMTIAFALVTFAIMFVKFAVANITFYTFITIHFSLLSLFCEIKHNSFQKN